MPNPIINNRLCLGGQNFDNLRPAKQAEGIALETNNKIKALLGYTITIGEQVVNKNSLKKWLKRTGYDGNIGLALKSKDIGNIINEHIVNRSALQNHGNQTTQPIESDELFTNFIIEQAKISHDIRTILSQKRTIAEVGYSGYFKDKVLTELARLDPCRFKANLQKIGVVDWKLENKAKASRVQALQQAHYAALMARTTALRAQEGANQLRAEEQERKKQRTVITFDEPVASSIKLPLTAEEIQPLLKPMVDSLLKQATELAAQEKTSEIASKPTDQPTKQVTLAPEKLEVRVLNPVKTRAETFGFVETPSSITAKFLAPFKQLFRQ